MQHATWHGALSSGIELTAGATCAQRQKEVPSSAIDGYVNRKLNKPS